MRVNVNVLVLVNEDALSCAGTYVDEHDPVVHGLEIALAWKHAYVYVHEHAHEAHETVRQLELPKSGTELTRRRASS